MDNKSHAQISNRMDAKQFYNKFGIFVILAVIFIFSSIISPAFLTQFNLINVLTQASVVLIISCGITVLLIGGMIDLSPGSVVALSGCVCIGTYKTLSESGTTPILAGIISILVAIGVSMALSSLSAFIVTTYDAPPFIVTLAMMTAARGLVLIYSGGQPIYEIGAIVIVGQGRIGTIPIAVIITIGMVIVAWILLSQTRFGRYVYALGGNKETAIASGIKVKQISLKAYLMAGAFTGVAGIIYMTRLNSGQPAEGVGLEFDAVTAAIIGGTSLTGGMGTILGTVAGAMIIGIINNILNLMSVQPYYQQIIKGAIIVVAVVMDIKTKGSNKV